MKKVKTFVLEIKNRRRYLNVYKKSDLNYHIKNLELDNPGYKVKVTQITSAY